MWIKVDKEYFRELIKASKENYIMQDKLFKLGLGGLLEDMCALLYEPIILDALLAQWGEGIEDAYLEDIRTLSIDELVEKYWIEEK